MSTATPPRLETERLVLREWRESDLPAHAAMGADPEVMRYLGQGRTLDEGGAWREIAIHIGHWALRGYGQWALQPRGGGESIGRAGLWQPPGWPGIEVGWKLARDEWGNGYATEAGAAAIDWAWENLSTPELISVIHPGNEASIRVAERLGMRRQRQALLAGQDVVIYEIARSAVADEVPTRPSEQEG